MVLRIPTRVLNSGDEEWVNLWRDLQTRVQTLEGGSTLNAWLTSVNALSLATDQMVYASGANTGAVTALTSYMRTLLDDADAATARATLDAQQDLDVVSQAEAEAGTATTERIWTAQRVSQAIASLADASVSAGYSAGRSTGGTNVTGAGTWYKLVHDDVSTAANGFFNTGSHYSTTTGEFTAPSTAKYHIFASAAFTGGTASDWSQIRLYNETDAAEVALYGRRDENQNEHYPSISRILELTTSKNYAFYARVGGDGSNTTDLKTALTENTAGIVRIG